MKLLTNFLFIFVVTSCQNIDSNLLNKVNNDEIDNASNSQNIFKKSKYTNNSDIPKIQYILEEPYYIDEVLYIPEENYQYNEIGLASFYNKELHNVITINNDFNKVTELLGRHKTLPLPSIVKITNLENGMFLTLKIIDRHDDNSTLIEVSRKTAQLLKFYKNKITKVRIEIIPNASKQLKIVTKSMSDPTFFDTINKAPTDKITILELDDEDIDETDTVNFKKIEFIEQPVEIGVDEVSAKELFLQVYGFKSYDLAKSSMLDFNISYNSNIVNIGKSYNIILGPLSNLEAKNLVLSLISKGYKKTNFILQ
jgi:rare lipoprotein A